MCKRLFLGFCFVLAAAVCLPMLSSSVYAQKGTKMKKETLAEVKAAKGGGEKGADPNIKTAERTNDPSSSGGAKGAVCGVFWDNYTNLYIKVFVDGDYAGMVSPMGELQTYAAAGSTRIYARADYKDGSYDYWGPTVFQCNPGVNYTRKLNN